MALFLHAEEYICLRLNQIEITYQSTQSVSLNLLCVYCPVSSPNLLIPAAFCTT